MLHRLLLLLTLSFPLLATAEDDLEKARAVDIANMRRIWEALSVFKKAKGEFPAELNELVPDYLPDANMLVSPRGVEADPRAEHKEYDPKLPCTYSYEFNTRDFAGRGVSNRELKAMQIAEWGDIVPILRCFLYEKSLNISHAGEFFEADANWEYDATLIERVKKNGPGPGMKNGKKIIVILTDPTGKRVPGVAVDSIGRAVSGMPLPDRSYTSNEEGRITITLGTDQRARVYFKCATPQWFLRERMWRFGDDGTKAGSDVAELAVVLQPASTAGGTVLDSIGKPVADVKVTYSVFPDPLSFVNRYNLVEATTDANGRWEMKSIPISDDTSRLCMFRDGHRSLVFIPSADSTPRAAELFSGKAEVRLQKPFELSGTTVSKGVPVAGAKIYFFSHLSNITQSGESDKDGRFSLGVFEPGKYKVGFVTKEFAPLQREVEISETTTPLTIELDTGRRATARVVRGKNIPVPNTPVLFAGWADEPGWLPERPLIGITDDNGRVAWEHAPKAVVNCAVLLPDGEEWGDGWDGMAKEVIIRIEDGN